MIRFLMALFLLLLSAGCSKPEEDASAAPAREQRDEAQEEDSQSALGKVVDEVTGIRAAEQGAELKNKINDIEAQRNRDMEDALNEEN